MAGVYSTQFLAIPQLTAEETYTVPSGQTAVIRDIDCCGQGSGTAGALLGFFPAGISPGVFLFVPEVDEFEVQSWRGRAVLRAGDVLVAYPTAGVMSVHVSGYLLAG